MSDRSNNLLPGVPLIYSPFFERLFPQQNPDAETQRIAADLRNKGYAVLDLPEPDFDRISTQIKERHAPSKKQWEEWRAGRLDLRVQDAWTSDPNVRRIAANEKIIGLLGTLFGRPAFPFQTLNFPVGTQQHVHSDNIHFASIPDGFMCGVWVALEDVDKDNGPLIYYPGSHKWPQYFNEHIGVNSRHLATPMSQYADFEKLWAELIEVYQAPPERFHAKKGQALIWLAHLLHGGDKQNDLTRTRHSQVSHYFFEGCSYYTPLHSDPFYGNIFFRSLTNIATGAVMPNMVSGCRVPEWFIKLSQAPIQPDGVVQRLARLKHRVTSRLRSGR
jgi:hypothetical protein